MSQADFAPEPRRRYLITGGTSGIGAMCAGHLMSEGHAVWVTGTCEETVARSLKDQIAYGASVCEVAEQDSVNRAFLEATRALGALDGVFINAGIIGEASPAEHASPTSIRRVIDVNVIGALNCAQAAYQCLERPGAIVFNASVNAIRPERYRVGYNASKAAVVSLASTLAVEWSREHLCVTSLCPGVFPTNMTAMTLEKPGVTEQLLAQTPIGRLGEPAEIGATVSFLLSGRSAFLTGAVIPIAGGSSL